MSKGILIVKKYISLIVLIFAAAGIGCQENISTKDNKQENNHVISPVSTTPTMSDYANKQANIEENQNRKTDKMDDENLISNSQIGKIHLGMTMKDILKIYPDAVLEIVSGTLDNASSDILVKAGGEKLFYFTTANFDDAETEQLPDETDKINFLMTDNSKYSTASDIKVGQTFGEAEKKYGKPKFFADDYFDFITFADKSIDKFAFYSVHKQKNPKNDYSPDAKITHIATGK